MDNERDQVPSAPSTPVMPGTPGTPLFGGFRQERGENASRKPTLLGNCKCFCVEADRSLEEGRAATPPPPTSSCFSPPPVTLAKRIGAEFIGTMILIFTGTATSIVNQKTRGSETLIGIAGSNGLAVMIVILSTGHISGAHLNPAITVALAALSHFPRRYVPVYIGTQVAASLCASFALKWLFHPIMNGGVTVPTGSNAQAFAIEFILTFVLMFVVTALSTDKRTVRELAGVAVGATVMLNILVAGEVTGASMNPVRTLGPAVAANNFKGLWVYLTAPFLGALCGAGVYSAVKLPYQNANNQDDKPARTSNRR